MNFLDPYVRTMVIRLISATVELTGALLMARFNKIDTAVRINGFLGLVGPLVLITATAVGLVGLANNIQSSKILLVIVGVLLILIGTR